MAEYSNRLSGEQRNLSFQDGTYQDGFEFLLNDRHDILERLKDLHRSKTLITVKSGHVCYQTIIVGIDFVNTLVMIDGASQAAVNHQLQESTSIEFSGEYQGVSFLFSVNEVNISSVNGEAVLVFKLPDHLSWIQRRKNYRVHIPLSQKGTFFETRVNEPGKLATKKLRLVIEDLNVNGVLLINQDASLQPFFRCNRILKGKLFLQNGQCGDIECAIRRVSDHKDHGGEFYQLIGCEILNLTNCLESSIQYYVQMIQIQNRNYL